MATEQIFQLTEILGELFLVKETLGPNFTREAPLTDLGKRQTVLEQAVYDGLRTLISKIDTGVELFIEGYNPVVNDPEKAIEYTWYVDPLDGTANTCRWHDVGARKIGSDFSLVFSLMPLLNHIPTFGDVMIGAGLDWRTGQFWIAQTSVGAFTGWANNPASLRPLKRQTQYHRHSPLLACEFYRHVNWVTRLLANQPVEWSDLASSFINILRVPLGETDCFFNNIIPEISQEGQRGHELGAIMPFITTMGGYAIDMRTGGSLANSPFTFDGMTPVIIGVDRETVCYYWEMMETNKNRLIEFGGSHYYAYDLIKALHLQLGTQRWSLRDLPKRDLPNR